MLVESMFYKDKAPGESLIDRIHKHKKWYTFESLLFIFLGVVAFIVPGATAMGLEIILGALLTVAGAAQIIAVFSQGVTWHLLVSGLLSLVTGVLMLTFPFAGTVAIATVLAAFLLLEGIFEIIISSLFRPSKGWQWLMFSGVISIVLGIALFVFWPSITVLFLGICVAINLILYGASLFALTHSKEVPDKQID